MHERPSEPASVEASERQSPPALVALCLGCQSTPTSAERTTPTSPARVIAPSPQLVRSQPPKCVNRLVLALRERLIMNPPPPARHGRRIVRTAHPHYG